MTDVPVIRGRRGEERAETSRTENIMRHTSLISTQPLSTTPQWPPVNGISDHEELAGPSTAHRVPGSRLP